MTRTALVMLAFAAAAPCATAQTAPIDAEVKRKLEAERDAQRAEDVEVLRRILNRAVGLANQAVAQAGASSCNACHVGDMVHPAGPHTSIGGEINFLKTFHRGDAPHSPHAAGPIDGVYLAGHGVVFTLRVPADMRLHLDPPAKAAGLTQFCLACHAAVPGAREALEPPAVANKPATEWDRTRDELRGAKPAEQPTPAVLTRQQVCDPGTLANRLVERLAANARHVRHLPAGERVTVVVTFDGVTGSARDRVTLSPTQDPNAKPAAGEGPFTPGPLPDPKYASGRAGFTEDEAKQLILGDLHLKQNNTSDAIAAYQRALARYKGPVHRTSGYAMFASGWQKYTEAQRRRVVTDIETDVRSAFRQLAQAWLAAADADKAQAALDLSKTFRVELTDADEGRKDKPLAVPAKLVVSVTKADVDEAGNDLAAFRRAVKVETIGFPPADKPR